MARQNINIGSVANDGTGDTIRAGGDKINDNFIEVYANVTSLQEDVASISYNDLSDLPTLGTSSSLDSGNAEGEVPTLGAGGLIPYALLPTGTASGTVAIGDHTHVEYAASVHTHAIADVTGLQTALDDITSELAGVESGLAAVADSLAAING